METEVIGLLEGILSAGVHCAVALYGILIAILCGCCRERKNKGKK